MSAQQFLGVYLRDLSLKGLRPVVFPHEMGERLQFLDGSGVKFEIRPITSERLSLYHRSNTGPMHYQKKSAPPTADGVRFLFCVIRDHECYEAHAYRELRRKKIGRFW